MQDNFFNCFGMMEVYEGWHEFSNDPRDPGGATYSGVIQRTWDAYCDHRGIARCSVRRMTDHECVDLYHEQYWKPIRGDELPHGIDLMVFDDAVNAGVARSVKTIQQIVGADADGIMGVHTLAAIKSYPQKMLIIQFHDQRLSFLRRLSTWSVFKRGWTERVNSVTRKALAMAGE